jgi:hypothetical protein
MPHNDDNMAAVITRKQFQLFEFKRVYAEALVCLTIWTKKALIRCEQKLDEYYVACFKSQSNLFLKFHCSLNYS